MAQKALAEKDALAEELDQLKQQDMGGMKLAEVEGALPGLEGSDIRGRAAASPVTPGYSKPCMPEPATSAWPKHAVQRVKHLVGQVAQIQPSNASRTPSMQQNDVQSVWQVLLSWPRAQHPFILQSSIVNSMPHQSPA